MIRFHTLLTALLAALLFFFLAGCAASENVRALKELLREPAVQQTLQSWSADADVTNPKIGFYLISGGEIAISGVILRGEMTGGAGGRAYADPPAPASTEPKPQETPPAADEEPVPATQPADPPESHAGIAP